MKVIATIVIIHFSCLLYGQSWTPKTSTWIYRVNQQLYDGYVRISYLKDTLVNNENCQLLKRDEIDYDYVNKKYSYLIKGFEITYFKNGIVYILNNNVFDTLYFFNSKINDTYRITNKSASSTDSAFLQLLILDI